MADVENIKDYFKKLQRVILSEVDFTFFGSAFIKKNKIDDVLCCILATLPEIYKKNLNGEDGKKLSSMIAYKVLFNSIKGKCIFNPNVYGMNRANINSLINTIVRSLERDIAYLEKKYQ